MKDETVDVPEELNVAAHRMLRETAFSRMCINVVVDEDITQLLKVPICLMSPTLHGSCANCSMSVQCRISNGKSI